MDWKSLSGLDKEKPGHYVWPGVYLHVIFDPNYPGVFCLYIGASMNVASRVEEHKKFRFTPSRDCLHYRIWNRPGRQDFFVLLGGIGNEPYRTQQQIILINLLEEVSCLMWQTLPSSVLRKALPDAISIFQPDIHLNRASPLRQIYNLGPPRKDNLDAAEEFTQGSLDLATSEDPEIRDYLEMRDRFKLLPSWRHAEGGRLSHVTHRKSQYKTMMLSQRQARPAQTAFLRRDPEISLGDRPDVLIQCKRCQHPDTRRFDPAPQYEISTGRYILRKTSCTKCCEIFGISNKYGISLPGFTETVDPSIPSVPITSLEYAARTGKERP